MDWDQEEPVEAEVDLAVDDALTRERERAVDECIAIVRKHFENDWNGAMCLRELEKLK